MTRDEVRLTQFAAEGARPVEPSPEDVAQVVQAQQERFAGRQVPYLLAGLDTSDDAAVYQVGPRKAIVQTVDFSPPVLDDPWTYGAVAAANAMSGVFAMGGEIVLAMNILTYPQDLAQDVVSDLLRGGAEKVDEAGGVIAGGHLTHDEHLKYGLAVTGVCDPRAYFTKAGARVGDQIYLTKPLGSGAITAAARLGRARQESLDEATTWMLQLNRQAAHLAARSAHSIIDVTGQGLLGHLWQLSRKSDAGILVETRQVPAIAGAIECISAGAGAAAIERNGRALEQALREARPVDSHTLALLLDPQISGGLIVTVPHNRASRLETRFQDDGLTAWRVGEVIGGEPVLELM